jgi:hypothetical protein
MRQKSILLTGLFLCACSSYDGGKTEDPQNPTTSASAAIAEAPAHLYTIELGDQHKITYRAYHDGTLVIGEQARNDRRALSVRRDLSHLRPVDAFRSLNPGRALPKALSDLQAFVDRVAPEGPEPSVANVPPKAFASTAELIPKDITSDPQTFHDLFGCYFGAERAGQQWGTDVYHECFTNVFGPSFIQAQSRWAIYKVAPYFGDVRIQVRINNVLKVNEPVSEGAFHWYYARGTVRQHNHGTVFRPKLYWYPDSVGNFMEIVEADDSDYHVSGRFHNYKVGHHGCAESWTSDIAQPGATHACLSHYD